MTQGVTGGNNAAREDDVRGKFSPGLGAAAALTLTIVVVALTFTCKPTKATVGDPDIPDVDDESRCVVAAKILSVTKDEHNNITDVAFHYCHTNTEKCKNGCKNTWKYDPSTDPPLGRTVTEIATKAYVTDLECNPITRPEFLADWDNGKYGFEDRSVVVNVDKHGKISDGFLVVYCAGKCKCGTKTYERLVQPPGK